MYFIRMFYHAEQCEQGFQKMWLVFYNCRFPKDSGINMTSYLVIFILMVIAASGEGTVTMFIFLCYYFHSSLIYLFSDSPEAEVH